MRRRGVGRTLRQVDRVVEALEPVQDPQLVADDPRVLGREELARRRDAIEVRRSRGVAGTRPIELAIGQRGVGVGHRRVHRAYASPAAPAASISTTTNDPIAFMLKSGSYFAGPLTATGTTGAFGRLIRFASS